MKRRIVSVLMALVMALSLLPVQALAEDAAVGEPVTEIEQAEQIGGGRRARRPGGADREGRRTRRPGGADRGGRRARRPGEGSRSRGSRRSLRGNLYRARES